MPDWEPEDADGNIDAPDEWAADAEEEPEIDDSLDVEADEFEEEETDDDE